MTLLGIGNRNPCRYLDVTLAWMKDGQVIQGGTTLQMQSVNSLGASNNFS